jgi:hypothetical protein
VLHSEHVPIPTPRVSLDPPCLVHSREPAIPLCTFFYTCSLERLYLRLDDLVAVAGVAETVLASEEGLVGDTPHQAYRRLSEDADSMWAGGRTDECVQEHDPMPKAEPWLVFGYVLEALVSSPTYWLMMQTYHV